MPSSVFCRVSRHGVRRPLVSVAPFLAALAALILSLSAPLKAADKPVMLVSIAPIALIARELAGDAVEVQQLLPAQVSAHDYALKISDQRRLRAADKVVWIGPSLESFLAKSLRQIPSDKQLGLGELAGLHFPAAGLGAHAHGHEKHDHGGEDFHIWLDPRNAQVMATALSEALAALAPGQAQAIQARYAAFVEDARSLDAQLASQLESVKARGFVVYHPGYDHLVARYGLTQLDFVALTPERKAGARHLADLQADLQGEAMCLFKEPFQAHARIDQWAAAAGVNSAMLYPLGQASHASYRELMQTLAATMLDCLTPVTAQE